MKAANWIVESEMFANVSRIHDKPQAIRVIGALNFLELKLVDF